MEGSARVDEAHMRPREGKDLARAHVDALAEPRPPVPPPRAASRDLGITVGENAAAGWPGRPWAKKVL